MEQRLIDKLVNYLVTVLIVNVWHKHTDAHPAHSNQVSGFRLDSSFVESIDLESKTIVLIFIVQQQPQKTMHKIYIYIYIQTPDIRKHKKKNEDNNNNK